MQANCILVRTQTNCPDFIIKTAPAAVQKLMDAKISSAEIKSFVRSKVGKGLMTWAQIEEIAKDKMPKRPEWLSIPESAAIEPRFQVLNIMGLTGRREPGKRVNRQPHKILKKMITKKKSSKR